MREKIANIYKELDGINKKMQSKSIRERAKERSIGKEIAILVILIVFYYGYSHSSSPNPMIQTAVGMFAIIQGLTIIAMYFKLDIAFNETKTRFIGKIKGKVRSRNSSTVELLRQKQKEVRR